MTPRWKIKFKYTDGNVGETKFYNKDKQSAYDLWSKDFEIISIEQDTDDSYLDYINRIRYKSELVAKNDKKQIYKLPHNDSYILVKLYTNDNEYYDHCEFQRWDCCGLQNPISWTLSNPKDFCEMLDDTIEELPQGFVVTPKEIKKMKAKKFYNKKNQVLWIDDLGYIYSADKYDLPNKYNTNEWDKFHDNPNAILVEYVLPTLSDIRGAIKVGWFENEESFFDFYEKGKAEAPSYATSPRYSIKKKGYTKLKTDERKCILRLPYINLKSELKHCSPVEDIALSWSKMCDKTWRAKQFDCYDFLIGVVKIYKGWLQCNENT